MSEERAAPGPGADDEGGTGTARRAVPERHGSPPNGSAANGSAARGAPGGGGPDDPSRRDLATWLWRLPVLAALGGGAWAAWRAGRVHFVKPAANPTPRFTDGPELTVAPLTAFGALWAAREFVYATTPAIVIRLPEAIPGGLTIVGTDGEPRYLAGFSRVCTHQGCLVRLARDAEAVAVATNYRGDGPSLFCGCHLSVFAPLRGGRAVAGPAQRPLPRVALELRPAQPEGDDADPVVVATGREIVG